MLEDNVLSVCVVLQQCKFHIKCMLDPETDLEMSYRSVTTEREREREERIVEHNRAAKACVKSYFVQNVTQAQDFLKHKHWACGHVHVCEKEY